MNPRSTRLAVIATILIPALSSAYGEDETAFGSVINVSLQFNNEKNCSVIQVSDGTSFTKLSAIASALANPEIPRCFGVGPPNMLR